MSQTFSTQSQPGVEQQMHPPSCDEAQDYIGSGKLTGKAALVTGGDSGIGRAVAIGFAKEGADVAIVYLNESDDAAHTKYLIEKTGRRCEAICCDIGICKQASEAVEYAANRFGGLDVLVNNAGEQHPQSGIENISEEQLAHTFRTNIFGMFFCTQAALPHMTNSGYIINTASVTAYHGNPLLLDYSATKGAIIAFTRSLAIDLASRDIRVNAVAPGPIWTPLIPSTFSPEQVKKFGSNVLLKRPGQPDELIACYVLLASDGASYMTGQTLHPNGGSIINS